MEICSRPSGAGFPKGLMSDRRAFWKTDGMICFNLYERKVVLKSSRRKTIFILTAIACLYFAGVFSIIYPILSNISSMSTARTVIDGYSETVEKMDDSQINAKFRLADRYNQDIAEKKFKSTLRNALGDDGELICYLEIPKISVYLPVYYGTSNEVLEKGCGLLENTSLPVGGNSTHSVISGHTGLPSADIFTKLDHLEQGDVFYIHILNCVLAYKVDRILTVTPDQTDNLTITEGEDYVTLLTCTPYGINDKRLLVRGARTEYTRAASGGNAVQGTKSSADNGMSDEIRKQTLWVITIVITAAVVFAAACFWLLIVFKKTAHQKSEDHHSDSGGKS